MCFFGETMIPYLTEESFKEVYKLYELRIGLFEPISNSSYGDLFEPTHKIGRYYNSLPKETINFGIIRVCSELIWSPVIFEMDGSTKMIERQTKWSKT
jgi:hypothetical protein